MPSIPVGSVDEELRLARVLLMRTLEREQAHRLNTEQSRLEVEQLRQQVEELEARRDAIQARLSRWDAFQAMLTTKHKRMCRSGLRYAPVFAKTTP